MLRNKLYNLLVLMGIILMFSACSKDEIVFEHEKQQFPTKEGAYLLEVIMPQNTNPDDNIYIVGAFNGGDAEAVIGDLQWKLEKCQANNIKWGIYLYPSDFASGTSLADGYTFVNEEQGLERSLTDEPVVHTEEPALGGYINVTVDRWESYFMTPINPDEVPHDGFVIYVDDQTTWDALALYAWGSDLPELFGGWPGATPTGTITIGSTKYKYFDTGEANKGLTYNLIFNNNGGGIQFDGPAATLDRDYYIKITDGGWEETEAAPSVTHDGFAIFVTGDTGWDEIAMYGWGDGLPEIFGGWPGIPATGEQTINGVTYKYFDTGEANKGLLYNFILNNNNNGKQFDLCSVTLDRDYYYLVDGKHGEEIDPANPPTVGPVEPDPDPVTTPHTIYINNTLGWAQNALYAWGDKEMFGGWPGKVNDGEASIDGANYLVFNYDGAGETLNLIINDNGAGQQIDGPAIVADRDYYFMVTADGWQEVNPQLGTEYRIYVNVATGWSEIALYAWGDVEMFGGWPGARPSGSETVDGVDYQYFNVIGNGESLNLILNNNGAGEQIDGPNIKLDRDYYFTVSGDGWAEVTPAASGITIYVDNLTGWDALAMYAWGDSEMFGGWPGMTPTGTVTVGGIEFQYFAVEANGHSENLIFNNNGAGSQLPDFNAVMNRDYWLRITAEGVTEIEKPE